MDFLISGTTIEHYKIGKQSVYVKREDLCCPKQGPPFAKLRGLYPEMLRLKNEGVTVVGYVETSISMAGWGVAWMAKELGMKCIIFCPEYKGGRLPGELKLHKMKWEQFGAHLIYQKAGRATINFYKARKIMREKYSGGVLLPLGLRLEDSVKAVSEEFQTVPEKFLSGTLVVCVGSGTMLAGILKGLSYRKEIKNLDIIGVMCYYGNVIRKIKKIKEKAITMLVQPHSFRLVSSCYKYTDKVTGVKAPFPCNSYYDLKAWEWLCDNVNNLKGPILFWNIGSASEDK